MEKTTEVKELYAAMVKAQNQMGAAKKSADNPFFKKKYADLSSVIEATKGPLHDNGLAIMQFPIVTAQGVGVRTMLIHESGQSIEQELILPVQKHDPQSYGSAITYARRYEWQSICGIPCEDDDGNYATRPAGNQQQSQTPVTQQPSSLDPLHDEAWGVYNSHKESLTPDQANWCVDCLNKNFYQDVINHLTKGANQ